MFHIGDKIALTKDIPVKGVCYGIESFGDGLIVGFQSPTPRVEILSDKGAVLNASNTSFSDPHYILVDFSHATRILVSDRGKKKVYMLDVGLQLLQAFQLPSDGEPYGLAAVGGGQVLVADLANLTLLKLTTGQWQTLLGRKTAGLRQPTSLVYNQAMKLLYVWGGMDDEIKVYTVSE